MYNIITVGDAVVDTQVQIDNASVECDLLTRNCQLCLDYAAKIPITSSFQSVGGDGANVATGASKLGLKSAIITTIGDDSNGKKIEDELCRNNVNCDLLTIDPKAETRYSIVLNYKGERTILSLHQKKNYVWPKELPATDWIYYTGLSEGFEALEEKMFKFLVKHPTVRLAANPGSYQLKHSLEKVRNLIKKTDILIVNLEEAQQILNTTLQKEKSVESLIHHLLILGAKEVAITNGEHGAWAGNKDEMWKMQSFPVKVIGKTGAGDAFSSGYVSARCLGHDIKAALSWGVANSCAIISDLGAQKGLLDQKGIEKMLTKHKTIRPIDLI